MTDELATVTDWLFKGWQSIGRILIVGVLAYAGLLIILRISGKRTLSKLNAFDLVVTVALGSTLSTIIVSRQTGVADGLTALALLVFLQYVVAWLSVRWPWFERFIKDEPTLLFHQGHYLKKAMREQRVNEDEVLAAIRSVGAPYPDDVMAVVLETDGSLTVIQGTNEKPADSLKNVQQPGISD
ncbi:YetF domain-containing protein [Spirosoma sp. SC4-14]|uniref:DUF421 domain-containing protein n=1 Tax=Spirosoma sp. SC4-14 TaxID=3128900 RepID=UPI0030D520CF